MKEKNLTFLGKKEVGKNLEVEDKSCLDPKVVVQWEQTL